MPAADRPPKERAPAVISALGSSICPILAAYVLRHPKPVGGAASSEGKKWGGDVERATRGVRKGLLCYVNRTKNCHRLSPHFRRGGKGRLVYHTTPTRYVFAISNGTILISSFRAKPAPVSVRGSWPVRTLFGRLCGFDGARVVSYVFF